MRDARDILGRLELVACVAIAACSPSVTRLCGADPRQWSENVVKHAEALRKTLRWAWAARVEEDR